MAAVRRGMTLGDGIAALRDRVRKVLDTTKKRAEAIVRTAANAASNRARQVFFKENKKVIKWLVWVATLDSRTCVYCGAQDGKRYRIDKGPRPPAHLNCRCSMTASVDGRVIGERPMKRSTEEDLLAEYAEEAGIKPVKRRASLPRGHKGNFDKFARRRINQLTGRVPASETFDEFLRKQSPAFQNKVLREQVADWYRKRRVDLDDLFDDDGDIFSIEEILERRPDLREAA
ncbi:MAG: phage minor head protein [Pseudomonadota bacterium]